MAIQVRIRGDKELVGKLKKLGISVSQVLEAATLAAAKVIEDAAEPLAPGPNIDHEVKKKTPTRVTVHVGPDADHWHYRFAEFGAGAHPISGPLAFEGRAGPIVVGGVQHPGRGKAAFLRPAVDGYEEEARGALGDVLKAAVTKV